MKIDRAEILRNALRGTGEKIKERLPETQKPQTMSRQQILQSALNGESRPLSRQEELDNALRGIAPGEEAATVAVPTKSLQEMKAEFTALEKEKQRKVQRWDMEGNYLGIDEGLAADYDRQLDRLRKDIDNYNPAKTDSERDNLIERLKLLDSAAAYVTTVEQSDALDREQREVREALAEKDRALGNAERFYGDERDREVISAGLKQYASGDINLMGTAQAAGAELHKMASDEDRLVVDSGYAGWATDEQSSANIAAAMKDQEPNDGSRGDGGIRGMEEEARRLYEKADRLSAEAAAKIAKAKEGRSWGQQAAVDIGTNLVQMGLDAAGRAAGLGMLPFFARAAGSGAQEARQEMEETQRIENERAAAEGRDPVQLMSQREATFRQLGYGLTVGAIEVATEKLFDGVAGAFGGGTADKVVEKLIRRLASSNLGRTVLRSIAGAGGEGFEEVISDMLNPLAKKIYSDKELKELWAESADQMLYDFFIGAAVGGLGSAGSIATGQDMRKNYKLRVADAEELTKAGASPETVTKATGLEKKDGEWVPAEGTKAGGRADGLFSLPTEPKAPETAEQKAPETAENRDTEPEDILPENRDMTPEIRDMRAENRDTEEAENREVFREERSGEPESREVFREEHSEPEGREVFREEHSEEVKNESIPDGGQGRISGEGAGRQAGRMGAGTERRAQALEQITKASERNDYGKNLREISSRELGLPEGTETKSIRIIPQEGWDKELADTAEKIKKESGRQVEYVLGRIPIKNSLGATSHVRGLITDDKIVIQADNTSLNVSQIAEHELYHAAAASNPGTNWYCEQKIKEKYGPDEFNRVLDKYIEKLWVTVNVPENATQEELEEAVQRITEEIYADAYAGINAFGAGAHRFREEVRETVRRGNGENSPEITDKQGESPGERGKADKDARYSVDEGDRDANIFRNPNGYTYRNDKSYRAVSPGENAVSDYTGYGMFADDPSEIRAYGDSLYSVDHAKLEDIENFIPKIAEAWDKAAEEESLPFELQSMADAGVSGEAIAAKLNPEAIVDGAEGWDDPDLTTWIFDSTGIFDGITGVKTNDGAIIFDSELAKAEDWDAEVIGQNEGENGKNIRYSVDEEDRDTEGNELSEQQAKFFKNSKVRDEKGRLRTLWHQTGAEFTVFNTGNELAGQYDSETPTGMFFKTTPKDIGIGGDIQMAVYLNAKNLLEFKNREEAKAFWLKNIPEYKKLQDEYDRLDAKYDAEYAEAEAESDRWYDEHYDDYVNDKISMSEVMEHVDAPLGVILDEWKAKTRPISREQKMLVTQYMHKSPYDGMHLAYDGSRRGVDVDTYIAFSPEQIKSVSNKTPTADPDIRYSLDEEDMDTEGKRPSVDDGEAKPYNEEHSRAYKKFIESKHFMSEAEAKAARAEKAIKERDKTLEKLGRERDELKKKVREELKEKEANAPSIAKKELRQQLTGLFSVPAGEKAKAGKIIDSFADRLINKKEITEKDRQNLFERLYEAGVMTVPADEYYARGRGELADGRIYVNDSIKAEFGDDWNSIRQRAFAAGIYLTNNPTNTSVDGWNADLAEILPGLFKADELDGKAQLERIIQVAEDGKDEKMSLAEYTAMLAEENYISEDEILDDLERKMDIELQKFAASADIELKLRDRDTVKDARERAQRREQLEKNRERAALKELQPKTLKQLQWLSKNRNKAPKDLRPVFDAVLGDIDIFAAGAANEMNWSKKYGATWKDLREMYKVAKDTDPNFLPSEDLERIMGRLENSKIADMDIDELRNLYNAALGLRKEFYDRKNALNDGSLLSEVFDAIVEELKKTAGKFTGKFMDGLMNLQQLTPMNVIQRMVGWNPDSVWYKMGQQLEQGERDVRAFKVKANKHLEKFLKENEKWVRKADGQGKDAIWYEIEVPELLEFGKGDLPIFGDTVKVYMTPSQKVHMYLESKGYDNLRHMEGGRTFVNKELYSKGKRKEAYAQGKTIKLAPETVKKLVSDLTPEEKALADVLESFYNDFSKKEINRVSNIVYGYDKAMDEYYAPIYTNQNYTQSKIGMFDATAEGVGNLKERVHSQNPSYNISAFDAFERSTDMTSKFVGMTIPVRNWQKILNWRTDKTSMADEITHKWGAETKEYFEDLLTDLQGGRPEEQTKIKELIDKVDSSYITSVFGANPSIVLKQLGSIPMGSVYLGIENFPSVSQLRAIDRELISKYTQELDYRLLGYSSPETKQLKEKPNWTEKNEKVNFWLGGGAITAMDGWAASTLWAQAENKVAREHPEIPIGTEEQVQNGQSPFYHMVAEEFNNAVAKSQSTSDIMHQSTLRRSKSPFARAFTRFKSDSAQTYNAIRQTIGELQYYKQSGAPAEKIKQAEKAVGTAFVAAITNAAWGSTVTFMAALIKNGAKYYRDDEDELTASSFMEEFVKEMVGNLSSIVIGGEELASKIGEKINGEYWNGFEAPGLQQLSKFVDDLGESLEKSGNRIRELHEVRKNGGSVSEYFHRHGREMLGNIKDIAEALATYIPGLPVKNVENYLLGLVRTVIPQAAEAYNNLTETPTKNTLRKVRGEKAAVTEVNGILKNRFGAGDKELATELSRLYNAGYTAVIPSDTPDSFSAGGTDVELNAAQQQTYDRVFRESIGDSMSKVTHSSLYKSASDEEKAKMLRSLYEYGGAKAKAEISDEYEMEKNVLAADTMLRAGAGLEDWAAWDGLTKGLKDTEKYQALADIKFSEEVKLSILGTLMDTKMTNADGKDSTYALMRKSLAAGLNMAEALELREEKSLDEFLEFAEAGLDSDVAMDIVEEMGKLPEDAKAAEEYLAIADLPYSEEIKAAALETTMSKGVWEAYQKVRAADISSQTFCEFYKAQSGMYNDKDENGKSIANTRRGKVFAYIDKLNLTKEQKNILAATEYSAKTIRNAPWN